MNSTNHGFIRPLGLFVVVLLGGCGGGGSSGGNSGAGAGSDTTVPTIVGTDPLDAATGVGFNAVVVATLSEPIDPASVLPGSLTVEQGAVPISGSLTLTGSTVSFQPDVALRSGLTYTATLDAGISDLAGNPLGTAFTWDFTVAPYNLAFVTSVSGSGDLSSWTDADGNTGLAAGDAICQKRAEAAGLANPGNFVAWLSDENDDAYCRIHGLTGKRAANCGGLAELPAAAGPWVRTDGFPFAGEITELLDGNVVYSPVRLDEFAMPVPDQQAYFTGTFIDGSLRVRGGVSMTCNDWTSGDHLLEAAFGGSADLTSGIWTSFQSDLCDTSWRLLCMQTGTGPGWSPFVPTGKKVFVTSTSGTGDLSSWSDAAGNTGLAAGDAICQAHADRGGLDNPGSFKAWLSDGSADAKDRITSNGPWVRVDGVRVADDKPDLLDGSLFTSINVDENGAYLGFSFAWSGTTASGDGSSSTCDDWGDGTSGFVGLRGLATSASARWSDHFAGSCQGALRLYCFED